MSGQSIADKGHWFSWRRRRMQLVIAAAVVLIGLLAATGTGLLSIFGSGNQLQLERDHEWIYANEGRPGRVPYKRIRVKADRPVDAWRILHSDDYAPGSTCDQIGSAFEAGSGTQFNPYSPGIYSGILRADSGKRWVELAIRSQPLDNNDTKYCFKAVDYPERNDNKYVATDDGDTKRVYLEVGPLDMDSPAPPVFTQTEEGVLEVQVDKDVWKLRARRSDTLWLDANGDPAECGWQAYGGQGRKADSNTGYTEPSTINDRNVGGAGDADFLTINLEESDVGKYFCVLLLDYYGRYNYFQTSEIQQLSSSALLVSFSQSDNAINAGANQDVAWRSVKTRSWKACDNALFETRIVDQEGEIGGSITTSQGLSHQIEAPYSYQAGAGGGRYTIGSYSYCFESTYNDKKFYNKSPAVFDPEPTIEVAQDGNTLRAVYPDGIASNFQVAGPFDGNDFDGEDCENKQFGSSYSSPQSNRYNTVFEKQVDADDNEKYYCFMVEADDASGGKGYKEHQVSLAPEPEPDPDPDPDPEPEPEPDPDPAPVQDTTPPDIVVRFDHVRTALVATTDEEATGWSYRGPLSIQTCGRLLFVNDVRSGSEVLLTDPADNGRWYCFRAQDAAGNWGFAPKQAPDDAVPLADTAKPSIDVQYLSDSYQMKIIADEPVKWSTQIVASRRVCSVGVAFSSAATTYKPEHVITMPDGMERFYCFKGVDSSGNVGYSTASLADRQAPRITLDTSRTNEIALRIEDNSGLEEIKYDIPTRGHAQGPCGRAQYTRSAQNLQVFRVYAGNHGRYLCVKAVDSSVFRHASYSSQQLLYQDVIKPRVSLSISNNRLLVTASDSAGIAGRRYIIRTVKPDCSKLTYTKNMPAAGVAITSAQAGSWICVEVVDGSAARNVAYASKQLEHTAPPVAPPPPPQPAQYKKSTALATYYDWGTSKPGGSKEENLHRAHLDNNFNLKFRRSDGTLEVVIDAPPKLALVGEPDVSYQIEPSDFKYPILYKKFAYDTDAQYRRDAHSDCDREAFPNNPNDLLFINEHDADNAYNLQLTGVHKDRINNKQSHSMDIKLRSQINSIDTYCFKVFLKGAIDGDPDVHAYKIFLVAVAISSPGQPAVEPVALDLPEVVTIEPLEEARITPPTTTPAPDIPDNIEVNVEQGTVSVRLVALGLGGPNTEAMISKVRYFAATGESACSVDAMESLTESDYTEDTDGAEDFTTVWLLEEYEVSGWLLEWDVDDVRRDREKGEGYCYLAFISDKDDAAVGDWAELFESFSDLLSYWDSAGGATVSSASNRVVEQTNYLELELSLDGDDRLITAQVLTTADEEIKADTWKRVALDSKDEDCNEDVFGDDSSEIATGRTITNPDFNKQYCFRVEDDSGQAHYISYYLEEDAFDDLSEEGDSDGLKWMPIVVASAAVVLLATIVVVLVIVKKSRSPKFK